MTQKTHFLRLHSICARDGMCDGSLSIGSECGVITLMAANPHNQPACRTCLPDISLSIYLTLTSLSSIFIKVRNGGNGDEITFLMEKFSLLWNMSTSFPRQYISINISHKDLFVCSLISFYFWFFHFPFSCFFLHRNWK